MTKQTRPVSYGLRGDSGWKCACLCDEGDHAPEVNCEPLNAPGAEKACTPCSNGRISKATDMGDVKLAAENMYSAHKGDIGKAINGVDRALDDPGLAENTLTFFRAVRDQLVGGYEACPIVVALADEVRHAEGFQNFEAARQARRCLAIAVQYDLGLEKKTTAARITMKILAETA